MDHFRETKNHLTWSKEGKFEAEITNGVITKLRFLAEGKSGDSNTDTLISTNLKFLENVHESLGELLVFMQQEAERNGIKFSNPPEERQLHIAEKRLIAV